MPISEHDRLLIYNDIIRRLTDDGLYITSAQDNARWVGPNRVQVPISASPLQTSGAYSPLELIVRDFVNGITEYYSVSAIGVSSLGLIFQDPISGSGNYIGLKYNVDNLKIDPNGQLNTIQNISSASDFHVGNIYVSNLVNGQIVIVSGGRLVTSAINTTSTQETIHNSLFGLDADDHTQYIIDNPQTSVRNFISADSNVTSLTLFGSTDQTKNIFNILDTFSGVLFSVSADGTITSFGSVNISGSSKGLNFLDNSSHTIGSPGSIVLSAQNLTLNANSISAIHELVIQPGIVRVVYLSGTNDRLVFANQFGNLNEFNLIRWSGNNLIIPSLSGSGDRYVIVSNDGTLRYTSASIGSVSGSGLGTINTISKFVTSSTLGDSLISENGSTIFVNGNLKIGTLNGILSGASGQVVVAPTIPIGYGGTNNTTFTGARFIWYDGSSLVSSPFTSGSFSVSANGTPGFLSKFSTSNSFTDSTISDNGTIVTIRNSISATGNFNLLSLSGSNTRYVGVDLNGALTIVGNVSANVSGTIGRIAKFVTPISVGDSKIIESGNNVSVSANLETNISMYVTSGNGGYWFGAIGSNLYGMRWNGNSLGFRSGSVIDFLSVNNSGIATFVNSTTFLSTVDIGLALRFTDFGTSNNGAIWRSNISGMSIRAVSGSSYDFALYSTSANHLIRNPKGTQGLEFPGSGLYSFNGGNVLITSALNVSGSVTIGTLAGTSTRLVSVDANGLLGSTLSLSNFVSGSGTLGKIPIWIGSNSLGDSIIFGNNSLISIGGSISANNNAQINGSLNVSGTGNFTNLINAYSGIQIAGGSFAQGKIYGTNGSGMIIAGKTGSSWDLMMVAADGSDILTVPIGSRNTIFSGNMNVSATMTNKNLVGSGTRLVTSTSTGIFGNATTIDGAYEYTGIISFGSAIAFSGFGISAQGSIYRTSIDGLNFQGINGSVNAFAIRSSNGTILLRNPQGTIGLIFDAPITMSSTLNISGSASFTSAPIFTFTSNKILYANSNGVVSTNSNLAFDGTTITMGSGNIISASTGITTFGNTLTINGTTTHNAITYFRSGSGINGTSTDRGLAVFGISDGEQIQIDSADIQVMNSNTPSTLYLQYVGGHTKIAAGSSSSGGLIIGEDVNPTGIFDVRSRASSSVIATFGNTTSVNSSYPGYIYFSQTNTINFGYLVNGNAAGWINYVGYQNSSSQFRDLIIGDGKGNIVMFLDGSSKRVIINNGSTDDGVGTLQVAGKTYSYGFYTNASYTTALVHVEATGGTYFQANDGGTVNVRFAPISNANPYNYFRRGTSFGEDVSPYAYIDARQDTPNGLIAAFGESTSIGSTRPAYIYFSQTNTINFGYLVNGNAAGWINYVGYNNNTTQFRDLYIADGKATTIAFFDGSTNCVTFGSDNVSPSSAIRTYIYKSNSHNYLGLDKTSTSYDCGINFANASVDKFAIYLYGDSNNYLQIQASALVGENASTPRMRFSQTTRDMWLAASGGKVRIGDTTTPSYTLDVNGDARISSNVTIGGASVFASSTTAYFNAVESSHHIYTQGLYSNLSRVNSSAYTLPTNNLFVSLEVAGTVTLPSCLGNQNVYFITRQVNYVGSSIIATTGGDSIFLNGSTIGSTGIITGQFLVLMSNGLNGWVAMVWG